VKRFVKTKKLDIKEGLTKIILAFEIGLPGETEKFWALRNETLSHKHLQTFSPNERIPLANLFHRCTAELSAELFPSLSAFKEAKCEEKF
jgi:hypothetical protein